jgi:class 3 adenylate cyclase
VNLAARVASSTEPGPFLVTGALHDAAPAVPGAAFRELPPRLVKGVAEPVVVCEVRPVSGR